MKLVVGIATFKRPEGLANVLRSLSSTAVSGFTVLVADNDSEKQQGRAVVEQLAASLPFEVKYTVVEQRGISYVRNHLLTHAFEHLNASMLAMIDDDERAEKGWLENLLVVKQQTNANVVGGRVCPEFTTPPPKWLNGLPIFYFDTARDSVEIELIEGTGNVLLDKSVYFELGQQRFDLFYALHGGGDKEYFTRLKLAGAKFAFANDAITYELFDTSRLTKSWAINRAYRIGGAEMRIVKLHFGQPRRLLLELLKISVALLLGLATQLLYCWHEPKRLKGRLLVARQLGKIAGLFANYKPEYIQTHGN